MDLRKLIYVHSKIVDKKTPYKEDDQYKTKNRVIEISVQILNLQ